MLMFGPMSPIAVLAATRRQPTRRPAPKPAADNLVTARPIKPRKPKAEGPFNWPFKIPANINSLTPGQRQMAILGVRMGMLSVDATYGDDARTTPSWWVRLKKTAAREWTYTLPKREAVLALSIDNPVALLARIGATRASAAEAAKLVQSEDPAVRKPAILRLTAILAVSRELSRLLDEVAEWPEDHESTLPALPPKDADPETRKLYWSKVGPLAAYVNKNLADHSLRIVKKLGNTAEPLVDTLTDNLAGLE